MSPAAAILPEERRPGSTLARQKALLMGYYGVRNLGDEMMLYCLSRWLGDQGIEVTVLAEDPSEVKRTQKLPAVRNVPMFGEWGIRGGILVWLRGPAWKVLKALRSSDLVVAGGGDTIRDDRGKRQLFYAIEKLVIGLLLRKKVCLLNVGLASVKTPLGRRLLRWIVSRSSMTVVRDDASFELCRSLGAHHLYRAEDITCSLPMKFGFVTAHPAPEQFSVHNNAPSTSSYFRSSSPDPYLLVCLRSGSNVYGHYPLSDSRLQNFAHALDHVSAVYGLRVLFMPFQAYEQQNDNEVHRAVFEKMSHRDRAQICSWTSDLRQAIGLIAGARCVIAMRLHAAVMAVASQRPCIVMPYDKKVSEFQRTTVVAGSIDADLLDSPEGVIEMIVKCLDAKNLGHKSPSNVWDKIRLSKILESAEG
jgi:polysaccharide pyruvyl transferase WcaK-like protein